MRNEHSSGNGGEGRERGYRYLHYSMSIAFHNLMCVYVPGDYHRLVASQRHTPPADEWDPHQLSGSLAGALVDSDNADILRTRSEPNG